MEATGYHGAFFPNFLHNNNHQVSVVNPLCINAFVKSKLYRHKTDEVGSMIIAECASKNDLPLHAPQLYYHNHYLHHQDHHVLCIFATETHRSVSTITGFDVCFGFVNKLHSINIYLV